MKRAFILIATLLVCLTATAQAHAPPLGTLRPDMRFAEMRTALPKAIWKGRQFKAFGVAYTKSIYANDALPWLGRVFNVVYERSGFPSADLSATIILPAVDEKSCGNEIARLTDDVSESLHIGANAWSDESPASFGRADSLGYGFDGYSDQISTIYRSELPEAQSRSGWLVTPQRARLATLRLTSRSNGDPDVVVWRSYVMVDDALVRVFGNWGASRNVSGAVVCATAVTVKSYAGERPPQVNLKLEPRQVLDGTTLAQQYLMADDGLPMPAPGVSEYRCYVDLFDGHAMDCHPSNAIPEYAVEITDPYAIFLGKHVIVPLELEEEDFAQRYAWVKAAPIPIAAKPIFDWSAARQGSREAGIQGLRWDEIRAQLSTQFDPSGNKGPRDETITIPCRVLDDLSVYCGKGVRQSAAATRPFTNAYGLNRRLARFKISPKLSNGADARGVWFNLMFKLRYE